MNIRPMADADASAVAAIEASFPSPWTKGQILKTIQDRNGVSLVAESSLGDITGWCTGVAVAVEGELYKIAVARTWQRQGIATCLQKVFVDQLGCAGIQQIFLEVRAGNHSALTFYQGSGWKIQGKRKQYYTDPVDDALLLVRYLSPVTDDRSLAPVSGK